jgi:hypothetical protein
MLLAGPFLSLRAIHDSNPRLLPELCNDCGRMVDFGTAANGD